MAIQMKKSMLKRIDCAYIPVSDVAKSADWYEKVLGLKLRSPVKPGRGAIMIMDNGQWLVLLPSPGMTPITFTTTGWAEDGEEFQMFTLCFETEDIEKVHASLSASGVWVEGDSRDRDLCGLQLQFKDPDGNKFQVYQQPVHEEN